jgi:hypothetical protein
MQLFLIHGVPPKMSPRFLIVHHFYSFQMIFDFRGVSESRSGCEEDERLKLAITLQVEKMVYMKMLT